jgi:lysophospholipase L1-like esterase
VISSFELNQEVKMANLYVFYQGNVVNNNAINNAVWHGDSLTYGQNGSNPGTTSATRLAVVLNAVGATWQGTNFGHPGHTITQMISELGSGVNGLYDRTKQKNYLIAQGGHNDIVQGADASTVISRIQNYCSTALAANPWTIIWSTEPPASDPPIYPPNFDSIRDTVNSYIRQHWQSLGIAALSDFALDPQMGCDGCEYNTTYYSNLDHTHPTDAGYTIWGNHDLAAVNSLNGNFQRERTQGLGNGHLRTQASGGGQLWYSVFNGTNWATDRQIQPLGISAAPAAVAWAGGITVFHQGFGDNGQLWYTYSPDGTNWGGDTIVQPLGMTGSPSTLVYNGYLDVFHQGIGNNGQLWYSSFIGQEWSEDTLIPNVGMSGSPAAVLWAGGITVFHQGYGNNGQLWYTYSPNGINWGGDTLVPNLALRDSPSAVVYNGLLYVFHQGGGNEGALRYLVFDGANWSGDTVIPNVGMSGSPAAVLWAGGITVFHRGYGDSGQLWYTYSPDGANWGGDTLVQNVSMTDSPSAVVY